VLRAQNVESNLWAEAAYRAKGLRGRFLWRQAHRLATWEGRAVGRAAATLALTQNDAEWLRVLSGREDRVSVVPAPFPELPAGAGHLPGEPAVVVFGSRGWLPNEDSTAWFVTAVWPAVRATSPGAVLHLFGADPRLRGPAVEIHPPPRDSSEAYAPGSILAVPLRYASGVRIKILEAWARGVPVIATPAGVSGLELQDGKEALIASTPQDFAAAIGRLHREPERSASLVEAARRTLRERHDPETVAQQLIAGYVAAGLRARRPDGLPPEGRPDQNSPTNEISGSSRYPNRS
jgi:glycosyltransferase involved in cell wall biosynthesis